MVTKIKYFIIVQKELLILSGIVLLLFHKVILNPQHVLTPAQDIWGQYYLWKWIIVSSITTAREIPLWNPYSFSGLSLIGNPLTGMFYPSIFLFFILPIKNAFGFIFIVDFFLISLFTYLFALSIKQDKFSALVTSTVFTLSGTLITKVYAGHLANIESIVWFPATLYFFEKFLTTKKARYILLQGLSIGLMILAGHMQFTFYGICAILIYEIIRLIYTKSKSRLRLGILFITPLIIGVFISAIQLFPSIEMSHLSVRSGGVSYDFASSFSFHPYHLTTLFFPYALGTPQSGSYWGKGNFWELCAYVGILPLLFALLSIYLLKKNHFIKIFIFLSVFSLLFSMGKYSFIFPIFYNYFPGFNLFRIPATFLFVYCFSIAVLAGFGIQFFITTKKPLLIIKNVLAVIGILSIVTLGTLYTQKEFLFQIITSVLAKYFDSGVPVQEIYSLFLKDISQFTLFIFSSLLILFFKTKSTNKNIFNATLFVIIASNLLLFAIPFVKVLPYDKVVTTPRIIESLKKDEEVFRIFDFTGKTHPISFAINDIESITGSDPTLSRSYRNFLWNSGQYYKEPYEPFIYLLEISSFQPLRLLNTKYIVSDKPIFNQNAKAIDIENGLYALNNSLPRAYIVPNALVQSDETKTFEIIRNSKLDFKQYVILNTNPMVPLNNKSQFQKVNIIKETVNNITIKIPQPTNGFLVISDSWNPSWNAYANGKKIPLYEANGILKALYVTSDTNIVQIKFEPISYTYGAIFSLLTILLLLILYTIFKNKKFNI